MTSSVPRSATRWIPDRDSESKDKHSGRAGAVFSTVMTTVPSRCSREQAAACLSLWRAGLWQDGRSLVVVDRIGLGPHPAYLVAATVAVETWPDAEWYLIAQDDIEVTQGLSEALWSEIPTDGVVSLFTPQHATRQRSGDGWWRIQRMRGSYGAQLIAWPSELLRWYVESWPHPERRMGADHEIVLFCRDRDIPIYFHNPSYVFHCGANASTLSRVGGSEQGRQCVEFLESIGGAVRVVQ